ncbi:terpene cyclase/mutase family protein [Neobacillus rhizophilus]|uniref:Terpene cyclase/mutase family protein n=1 Tax=Neobacillus rhizophilus TaxID=2833579 RepID=A0A942TZ31_9BACI|nr:terpene cyclase/mutase family protein [Neobacillus rhizophilus]MBS4211450.1 terpene cyclase/mutase family protein [Neobacillus rhizophilus]MBU8916868.1 hypothetical protein [Bacillus sp. FJAT-29953]
MRKATKLMVIAGALALAVPYNAYAAEDVSTEIASTAEHVQAGELNSDWLAISLSKAGKLTAANKQDYLMKLKSRVNGTDLKGTELHKTILAVRALGADPANFEGQDLIKKAYSDTSLNAFTAYVYALIALDSADYTIPADALWTKDKLIAKITTMDSTAGGWNWAGSTSEQADPDTTGMVLTALGKHKSDGVVKADINSAVSYLKAVETANGGFDNWGENSSSTAQVVIGLSSIGVDPTSTEFTKDGKNPVNHLFTYEIGNGGYKWMKSETAENSFATEQVFQALVAYDKFKSGDQLFSFPYQVNEEPVPSQPTIPAPTPTVVNNNNYVTVTPTTDVSKLPVSESTKEVIREIITNNNAGAAGTTGNTSSQPQVIVVQQPAAIQTAAGEPKVEVKVEKESGTFNSNNLKVGGTTAFIGALALVLRRKFLGV